MRPSIVGLQCEVFATVPGIVALPSDHRLEYKAVITSSDLVAETYIALNPEDVARKRLDVLLGVAGVTLNPVVETPYAITICELMALKFGVGVVSAMTVLDDAKRGIVLRNSQLNVYFNCLLALPSAQSLSLKAKVFWHQ
jgi:DNA-binding transcriptional LysR family regulator